MIRFFKRKPKEAEVEAPAVISLAAHERLMLAAKQERDQAAQRMNTDMKVVRKAFLRSNAELAIWRAHGQLRNPGNGRLIPKAETEAFIAQAREKQAAE